jgi:hypothetical protein
VDYFPKVLNFDLAGMERRWDLGDRNSNWKVQIRGGSQKSFRFTEAACSGSTRYDQKYSQSKKKNWMKIIPIGKRESI